MTTLSRSQFSLLDCINRLREYAEDLRTENSDIVVAQLRVAQIDTWYAEGLLDDATCRNVERLNALDVLQGMNFQAYLTPVDESLLVAPELQGNWRDEPQVEDLYAKYEDDSRVYNAALAEHQDYLKACALHKQLLEAAGL